MKAMLILRGGGPVTLRRLLCTIWTFVLALGCMSHALASGATATLAVPSNLYPAEVLRGTNPAGREGVRVSAPPLTLEVKVGWGDRFRPGTHTPVGIRLKNDGPSIQGMLTFELRQGTRVSQPPTITRFRYPVDLPAYSDKQIVIPVPIQQSYHPLWVRLEVPGQPLLTAQLPLHHLATSDPILLVLDARAGGWNVLRRTTPGERLEVVYIDDPRLLPEAWVAYEGVLGVVVGHFPLDQLSQRQQQALSDWIHVGGYLLLTSGSGGTSVAWSFASGPLFDVLPVRPTGRTRAITHLNFGQRYQALPPGPNLLAAESHPQGGEVVYASDDLVLAAIRKVGIGRTGFLAIDPTAPRLAQWPSLSPFLYDLLVPAAVELSTGTLQPVRPLADRRPRSFTEALLILVRSVEVPAPSRTVPLALAALCGLLYIPLLIPRAAAGGFPRPFAFKVAQPWSAAVIIAMSASALTWLLGGSAGQQYRHGVGSIQLVAGAPKGGPARSITALGLIESDRRAWSIADAQGVYLSRPLSSGMQETWQEVQIDFAPDHSLAIRPEQPAAFLPMTVERVVNLPVSVALQPDGNRADVVVENGSPYRLTNLVVLDHDRFTMLDEVPPFSERRFRLPRADDWFSGTPSDAWMSASGRGMSWRRGRHLSTALTALDALLRSALGRDFGESGPPWGLPAVAGIMETPSPGLALTPTHQGESVTLFIVPLEER